MPQGTIRSKGARSFDTLKAKPWDVTQRAMRTPMAPTFSSPTQVPVSPAMRAGRDAVVGTGPDHDLLEVPDVAVDVAPVGGEVEDRVAHDLPRAVIGDVAAPARLEELEAAVLERVLGEEHVLAPRVAAQGEDGVVLEEEQGVGDPPGLPVRHQLRLERVGTRPSAAARGGVTSSAPRTGRRAATGASDAARLRRTPGGPS